MEIESNYIIKPNKKDGNYFYSSISDCINNINLDLKLEIVRFYSKNKAKFSHFIADEDGDLIQTIITIGSYATYPIIKITAEYLNKTILLYRDSYHFNKESECFKPDIIRNTINNE